MAERPPPAVTNERCRSVSRALVQLGSALLAAAVVKIYGAEQVSLETGIWLLLALGSIWTGLAVLGLLEPEK